MKSLYILIPALFFFTFSVQPADAALRGACNVSPSSNVVPGEEVTWEVEPSGGSSVYEYNWTGSDGLSGRDRTTTISYETEGLKWAQVTVTSDDEQKIIECSQVPIEFPPLRGSCSVSSTASNEKIDTEWRANIVGGNGDYVYTWTGSDGLWGDSSSVKTVYSSGGFKEASVTVSSKGESIRLTCNTTIPPIRELSDEPITFGCKAVSDIYSTENELEWEAFYKTDRRNWEDDIAYRWDIDNERENERVTGKEYEESGYKVGIVTTSDSESPVRTKSGCQIYITDEDGLAQTDSENSRDRNGDGDGGGCFIATAAYGSLLEPEVETLRAFRDTQLETNVFGRTLIRAYYFASPPLASVIEKSDALRFYTRIALTPIIAIVKILN